MAKNSWPCPKCFDEETGAKEFNTLEELQAHQKAFHSGKKPVESPVEIPAEKPPEPPIEKSEVPAQKPVLTYRYEGSCCGVPLETIPLEMGQKVMVVAWCSACKQKKDQREVAKL